MCVFTHNSVKGRGPLTAWAEVFLSLVWFNHATYEGLHCSHDCPLTLQQHLCNSSRAGYFRFSAQLARTEIKQSNLAALLDFPSVIRPNGSNPDDETSNFVEVWTKPPGTAPTVEVKKTHWRQKYFSFERPNCREMTCFIIRIWAIRSDKTWKL